MNRRHHARHVLLASCGILVVSLSPHIASAQTSTTEALTPAKDAAQDGLADIVVTAEKRPTSLQKTPISMSVIDAEGLRDRHVVSLADLGGGAIPSLRVTPFYSRNSALIVNIRGVGVLGDANQPARDQGVGVYVDGVYLGRAQGLGTALFDVDSIEVLKGPQGTLFGRNTEGGALNITTKKPSGRFHVNAVASAGNFGSYTSELHVDLPRFHDFAVKLDGVLAHRDPLVDNPLQGARGFGQYDKRGLHGEVYWTPAANFDADYSFDTSYDASTSLYLQLLEPGSNKQAALGTVQSDRVRTANVGVPQQPSIGRTSGHRLTLEFRPASDLTLKSISSYRTLSQSQYDNGSASTTMSNTTGNFTNVKFGRYSLAMFDQDQFSQEVQAIGELPRLHYVAGALFYQEKVRDNAQAFATNQFTNAAGSAYTLLTGPQFVDYTQQAVDRASHITTDSIGAFGQATYTPPIFSDAVHITGGLRWTRDMKHGELTTVNNAAPINRDGVQGAIALDAHWSRVDPMISIAADLSNDVHVYGKWGTGYKSGGANSRSQNYDAFNPETISVFEIGAKTEFFDRHARFNIAAYAGQYRDIQVDFSRPYEAAGVRTTRTTTSTINAPGVGGIHGVEADLTVIPLKNLSIHGSYAFNYVHIPATINPYPNSAGNVSAIAVPIYQNYTPRHSGSVAIDYDKPMDSYTLHGHIDGNIDSGFYANNNDPVYLGPNNPGNVYQPKAEGGLVVNATLGIVDVRMGDGGATASFSIWARNLFNEQHVFWEQLSVTSGRSGLFNDPRTIGGEVRFRL